MGVKVGDAFWAVVVFRLYGRCEESAGEKKNTKTLWPQNPVGVLSNQLTFNGLRHTF